ncbi:MAG TPA: hypothetical protein VLH18_04960 [Candidatus Limnocylindrales bacterium]|nr:hypothetical protein [Candidatus Limnocylindrales bacterium]
MQLLFIAITCFTLSLMVIAQYSYLVVLNQRISRVRAFVEEIQETSLVLEREAAELSSISRIDFLARHELGMIEPAVNQFRVLAANQGD